MAYRVDFAADQQRVVFGYEVGQVEQSRPGVRRARERQDLRTVVLHVLVYRVQSGVLKRKIVVRIKMSKYIKICR